MKAKRTALDQQIQRDPFCSTSSRSTRFLMLAVLLLAACAAPQAGRETPAPEGETWMVRAEPSFEVGINASSFRAGDFRLDGHSEPWDSGSRIDVEFRYRPGLPGRIDPFVGAYFFHEEHDWDQGAASVDETVTGVGALLGVVFEPGPGPVRPRDRKVRVAMIPYARLGIGIEDGEFKNYPVEDGFSTGDLDRERFEGAAGLDVRVEAYDRVALSAGVGIDGWVSARVEGETRDGLGGLVDPKDRLNYHGWDLFFRVGLSVRF